VSVDDFFDIDTPPPNGADYLHYDRPVLVFMNSKYNGKELESLISKLLYGHHSYGEDENWVEILRFDYNPNSEMGHGTLHADVIREGEKTETLDREFLPRDAKHPVPKELYYYPHFVASYTRGK